MNIKKILIVLICLFVFTGCKIENISNNDILSNVDLILSKKLKYLNKDAIGYQYYLPINMSVKNVNDFNQELYYEGKTLYLYTDIVSYYHKVQKDYTVDNNAYISKKIDQKGKNGYLEINKVNDKYYVEMMYNYAKVEAYVSDYELVDTVSVISCILSSIKYNDNIIETLIGDKKYDLSGNETYNIFNTKKTTDSNFLDYINEYDKYNGQLDAETLIEKDEISTGEED
ncbi:MAG: hypothetical protein J6J17_04730 [Bacilli bacterium]|nr:hypothetical protein [Bacilli bacterium]